MAEYIVMPKLGFDMREGEFNAWVKEVGDQVDRGDVVAEIESDKATLELESQVSGTLLALLVEPGDLVEVGANVAIVGEEGEDVSDMMGDGSAAAEKEKPAEKAPEPQAQSNGAAAQQVQREVAEPTPPAAREADERYPGGVKATPVARRMARENGINLLNVPFEGERIRKADVEAYLEAGAPEPAPEPEARPAVAAPEALTIQPVQVEVGPDDVEVPASKLRQAVARRMVESKTTVPHFQVSMEIDMGAAILLRQQLNDMLADEGVKISFNDMIVKAAALALVDFPNLNASFGGENLVVHKRINVGSAVATERGLLTVVQKDTDKTTLSQIATENKEMIGRARAGKISPDDVAGSTFTVSNLGVYGVSEFIAIINPPEAAIMAVGGIVEKPIVANGEIAIGHLMTVTVSADHRVTDGAEVAEFLVRVKGLLENPMRLLV